MLARAPTRGDKFRATHSYRKSVIPAQAGTQDTSKRQLESRLSVLRSSGSC